MSARIALRILCAVAVALSPARAVDALVEHVRAHRDGRAAWSIDFDALGGDRAKLPVGVFDSGIGGLTVMDAILRLDAFNNDSLRPGADGRADFAGERFIYLGDQANMPYGNYAAQGREAFLRELIVKDAVFLLGTRWRAAAAGAPRFDKPPVKAIVIACNTATAYGIDDIRSALRAWKLDVPVIGVIEAGARATAASLPDDGKPRAIGVLATVGTCATGAYPKAIARAMGQAGKSAPVVVQQGSADLAATIERGEPKAVSDCARADVAALVGKHSGPPIETVVLGCTHFPLAETELAAAFKAAALDGVRFINPADATARELFRELALGRLREKGDAPPAAQFFLSVPNPRLPSDEPTVVVPLTAKTLPESSAKLVQSLPAVWRQMEATP
ncbi:MAG: aspartate/glutamate racemase family protein [Chthoniobacteraceae bacterium]